jgi:hypothetical protein
LKEQLETLRPGNTPSATRIRALHRKAAELIVDKDLEYLDFRPFVLKTEGRPNRKPGQDPWQSHYHDFVLDNPPTDSDAIDTILARLRQNHRDAYEAGVDEPVPGFNKLRGVWVAKHQGESFYPDSFFAPPEQQMPTIDELLVRQSAGCCVRTCVTL